VALAKGIAFLRLKHPGQALRVLQPLYQADPLNLTTQNLMANAYIHLKQFDLAAKHCREADRIGNGARNVRENLFSSLWLTGEIEECLEIGRSLLPGASAAFHLSYLTAFDHFTPDPEASKAAWKEWDQLYNSSTSAVPRSVSSLHPERLLRVGYLVSEIHRFPDWHFVPPLFENRGRTAFYSIGYLTKSTSRGYLKTVSRCFELMRDVRQQTPEQAAKHIAGDQVDILVNPCWDHRGHHLQIFAHRPAAIQIEIPLYPGTTGAAATDFIFTDPWVCPDGAESIYRERVYRLVESYVPWQPPPKAPDPSAAPIERNGYCTFGIFQKPIKLNSFVWDAVAEILRRAGDARLLMHQDSRDLDDESSGTRNRYVAVLARLGIRPERISFVGSRRLPQHYSVVSQVDIALDTFPYSGMTTTGDCLWMGVPVITYAGRTHASRVSHSMLTRLGFPELVAHSVAEYADKAVNLANNAKRIGVLRRELRDRMRNSHLTSGKAVMRGIEMAYRQIWRDYCAHKLELKEKI
jgi:predicted O-linked N-acetylglucosamine transferase (SPINDLY family)